MILVVNVLKVDNEFGLDQLQYHDIFRESRVVLREKKVGYILHYYWN